MTHPSPFISQIRDRQSASFGGIKVVTRDEHVCHQQLRAALKGRMFVWSIASGVAEVTSEEHSLVFETIPESPRDPISLLESFVKANADNEGFFEKHVDADGRAPTLVLNSIDFWLEEDPALRRMFIEHVKDRRLHGGLFVLVSRHSNANPELTDELSVVQHPLPTSEDTAAQLGTLLAENNLRLDEETLHRSLEAVKGLTSSRQGDAFSLGLVDYLRQNQRGESAVFNPRILRRYKEAEIGKLDFLEAIEPEKTFNDIVGNENFKNWVALRRAAFTEEARDFGVPVPRGCLCVGPPGTGKTRIGEATAHAWGFTFLVLDMGSLFGGILGETEANMEHAIQIAESMAPCVLLLDEVERSVNASGGERDGGASERVIAKLLTWMSLKTAPVFVMFTANNADRLPAALIRKGRLDETFMFDFPNATGRQAVFEYYLSKGSHSVEGPALAQLVAETEGWAPAEVEAIVGDARLRAFNEGARPINAEDLLTEINKTTPVAVSMKTQVDFMREWAKQYAQPSEARPVWAGSAKKARGGRKVSV